ncbi:MAG: phytoene/squalene synthase family protein [Chloroflexi bacterium]|nr:phytoene/squalene synthase family protein [Chloroflexota bacterium]
MRPTSESPGRSISAPPAASPIISLEDAMRVLEETSRTFHIPIVRLPDRLREAVASAYLCLRAIDEVEDHPRLDNSAKSGLLRRISLLLQVQRSVGTFDHEGFSTEVAGYHDDLPEVTRRVGEWACLAPDSIAPRIWDATAAMADRMAHWAADGWRVITEADLDRYTFGVAGAVGLMLSDLWAWHDGTQTDRMHAIGFGRGLQAVNILRNRAEDLAHGKDFFPRHWREADVQVYARRNLSLADDYARSLPSGPALNFCKLPLTLAHRTLDALERGQAKLSRDEVFQIMREVGYL